LSIDYMNELNYFKVKLYKKCTANIQYGKETADVKCNISDA